MTDPQDIPTRVIKFAEFLETSPPDSQEEIEDLAFLNPYYNQPIYTMTEPDIQLHCPSELCGGTRVFGCNTSRRVVGPTKWSTEFVTYFCRNCQHQTKIFALALKQDAEKKESGFAKLGEAPPFGPPVPARVITLVGPDRELFSAWPTG